MYITQTQTNFLQLLAKYKFLTVSQLHLLQVVKHKVSIYRVLNNLKDGSKPLISYQDFGFNPRHGKLEQILYLSKYGKKFLIEELGMEEYQIKMPSSNTLINQDYHHRIWTIDFHIQLDLFLQFEDGYIYFFDFYFDKAKRVAGQKYARAKNRIDIKANDKFIVPDGVVKFKYNKKDYLYLFEQHNSKDSGKLMTQIINHCLVIKESGAKEKYKYDRNNRVVIIFEFESTKDAVIKRAIANESLEKFSNFFLLKTNQTLAFDFNNSWQNLYGENIVFI